MLRWLVGGVFGIRYSFRKPAIISGFLVRSDHRKGMYWAWTLVGCSRKPQNDLANLMHPKCFRDRPEDRLLDVSLTLSLQEKFVNSLRFIVHPNGTLAPNRWLVTAALVLSALVLPPTPTRADIGRKRYIYTSQEMRILNKGLRAWSLIPAGAGSPQKALTTTATTDHYISMVRKNNPRETYKVYDTFVMFNGKPKWPGRWAPRWAPPVKPRKYAPDGWWSNGKFNIYINSTPNGLEMQINKAKFVFPFRRLGLDSYEGAVEKSTMEFVNKDRIIAVNNSGKFSTLNRVRNKTGQPKRGTVVALSNDVGGIYVSSKAEVILLADLGRTVSAYRLPSPYPNKQTQKDKRLYSLGEATRSYTAKGLVLNLRSGNTTKSLQYDRKKMTFTLPDKTTWSRNRPNATYTITNRNQSPMVIYYRVQRLGETDVTEELFYRYVRQGESVKLGTNLGESWRIKDAWSGTTLKIARINKKNDSFVRNR